jgi:hypothetical protein
MTGIATAIAGSAIIGAVTSKKAAKRTARAAETGAGIQAESGREAILAQQEAAARGQEFFEPFAGVAERGVDLSGFLGDPEAQFGFLERNPLFNLALENVNRQTQQAAASRGRLSAGDTLQQLASNVLLSAQPLISGQKQDIRDLLNLGVGVAGSQANIETGQAARVGNLLTDVGAAEAAGVVGAQSARTAGSQGAIESLMTGANLLSQRFPGGTFTPPPPPPLISAGGAGPYVPPPLFTPPPQLSPLGG